MLWSYSGLALFFGLEFVGVTLMVEFLPWEREPEIPGNNWGKQNSHMHLGACYISSYIVSLPAGLVTDDG